jgi:hypothetical protein
MIEAGAGTNSDISKRTTKRYNALPEFRYQDGYTLWATDLGKRGVKIELVHTQDVGGAIILPPKKAGECGKWLLETLGQDRLGLPTELSDILERLAKQKASGRILKRGDKKKIKDALKVLKRQRRKREIEARLLGPTYPKAVS